MAHSELRGPLSSKLKKLCVYERPGERTQTINRYFSNNVLFASNCYTTTITMSATAIATNNKLTRIINITYISIKLCFDKNAAEMWVMEKINILRVQTVSSGSCHKHC